MASGWRAKRLDSCIGLMGNEGNEVYFVKQYKKAIQHIKEVFNRRGKREGLRYLAHDWGSSVRGTSQGVKLPREYDSFLGGQRLGYLSQG